MGNVYRIFCVLSLRQYDRYMASTSIGHDEPTWANRRKHRKMCIGSVDRDKQGEGNSVAI
jgi:hypothetical protein